MPNVYTDEISNLIDLAVDDLYEGTGVNDKTLGKMYVLKKYEKACSELYDGLRKEVEVPPNLSEKKIIKNDKRFSAEATPRSGSEKLDKTLLRSELIAYLVETQGITTVRAAIAADIMLNKCTTVGKPSVAVTIVEDRRD